MHLSKYLAHAGVASRKGSSRLIHSGRVTVDDTVACATHWVLENQQVKLDGAIISLPKQFSSWIYHKPVGVDCRCLPNDPSSILNHLPPSLTNVGRIYPIGRLDKDSRGLLLLTNDGELCHQLCDPDTGHAKLYRVTVNRPVDPTFPEQMRAGVMVKGQLTRPCQLVMLTDDQFILQLTQGLNRQIRRMCLGLGYRVIDLQRLEVSGVALGELPEGAAMKLSESQREQLKTAQPLLTEGQMYQRFIHFIDIHRYKRS